MMKGFIAFVFGVMIVVLLSFALVIVSVPPGASFEQKCEKAGGVPYTTKESRRFCFKKEALIDLDPKKDEKK